MIRPKSWRLFLPALNWGKYKWSIKGDREQKVISDND